MDLDFLMNTIKLIKQGIQTSKQKVNTAIYSYGRLEITFSTDHHLHVDFTIDVKIYAIIPADGE